MSRAFLLSSSWMFALVACASTPSVGDGETDTSEATTGDGDGDGDPATGDGDPATGDGDGDGDGEPEPPSVLFIGNSYTSVNDLPGLVAALGADSPTPLVTDSLTVGGARVVDHLQNPELQTKLDQDFDVVVIQGQSVEPILDYPTFEQAVVELTDRVGMVGDARVMLYMTWPREEGSQDLIDLGMTVDDMWAGLESGYFEASLASGADIAYVGGAFMSALQLDPPIELYALDGSHPSLAGSYLAACVFFGAIVDRSCSTSGFVPAELPLEDAEALHVIADITNGIVVPGP